MSLGARRSPFLKYLLLEAPGWALALVVLGLLVQREHLSLALAALLFSLWVLKDFALYPLLREAYADGHADGTGSLLGALGTVRERLDPEGYVRVGSELWRAVAVQGHAPLETDTAVRIVEVKGLTLRVEKA